MIMLIPWERLMHTMMMTKTVKYADDDVDDANNDHDAGDDDDDDHGAKN